MIDFIIFSRNRAAQLDLLLRTLYKKADGFINKVTVLYKSDSAEYQMGYEMVIKNYTGIEWKKETSFQNDFEKIVNTTDKYVCMLPDDAVICNQFDDQIKSGLRSIHKVAGLSIRLHPKVDYCYPANKKMVIPKLEHVLFTEMYAWDVKTVADQHTCWGYPHNIDNIYSTAYLKIILTGLKYNNPNSLEAAMNCHRRLSLMICFSKSYHVLIPCNKVQDGTSRTEGGTAEELNNRFLSGEKINDPWPDGLTGNTSAQVTTEFAWSR
jgi:hypothetical protein